MVKLYESDRENERLDREEERHQQLLSALQDISSALLFLVPEPSDPPGATIPSQEGPGTGEGEKVAENLSRELREWIEERMSLCQRNLADARDAGAKGRVDYYTGRTHAFGDMLGKLKEVDELTEAVGRLGRLAEEKVAEEGCEEARGGVSFSETESFGQMPPYGLVSPHGLDLAKIQEEMARERRRVSTWPPGTEREEEQDLLRRLCNQIGADYLGYWKEPFEVDPVYSTPQGLRAEDPGTEREEKFNEIKLPWYWKEPASWEEAREGPTPDEISYQNSAQLLRLAALKFVNPRGRFEDLRPEINEILRGKYPSTEEMLSCTPPAPPPAAEPVAETSPGGERCTAGGAYCCEEMEEFLKPHPPQYLNGLLERSWNQRRWIAPFCPWCGEKLGGEG